MQSYLDNDQVENEVVENEVVDNEINILFLCCSCVLIMLQLFFILCSILFILLEIYFGFYYLNTINCETTITYINIPLWLIVKGFLSIVNIILILLILEIKKKSLRFVFYIFHYIINIFLIIWIIIGSIIYWKDCSYFKPYFINLFMGFSLISGYLSILYNIFNKHDIKKLNNVLPR